MMRHNFPRFGFIPLAFALLLIQSCTEPEVEPLGLLPRDSHLVHAEEWADSVLSKLSPEEKAAQLVWINAPAITDSAAADSFSQKLAKYQPGGIIYSSGPRDTLRNFLWDWQASTRLRAIVGLDASLHWSESQDWPSLLALGTLASDSIAEEWGKALGKECQYLGAKFCMVSASKVGQKGAWMHDALGANPEIVSGMSAALVAGLSAEHIQACIRPLYDENDFPKDSTANIPEMSGELADLLNGPGLPFRHILKADTGIWLQLSRTHVPSIDANPISESKVAKEVFLENGGNFGGLIVSPKSAGIESILAGADVWFVEPETMGPSALMLLGQLTPEAIYKRARKVLIQKALYGLDRAAWKTSAQDDPYPRLHQLHRIISKNTMVVLRDTKNRLPLGASFASSKVAAFALGSERKTDLQIAMGVYGKVDNFLYNSKMDSLNLAKQAKRLRKYDYVVLSLHKPLVKDSANGHLPNAVLTFLKKLDKAKKLIVVDFAGQASLHGLDSLKCLAFSPDDGDLQANIAGQAIMGAIPVTAKLPDDISAAFPAGSGKVLKRRIRFEYTDPQDLGIDKKAMWRIDSMLNRAIALGIFPGCQVLAAKDGQVFLNRSYGYHDYSRSRRVRNSDLYDIASVSKIAATTLMAMSAYDRDTLRLKQPLKYFLHDLDSSFITIKDITPSQLLIHQAGLPAGISLKPYYDMMKQPDSLKVKMYSSREDSAHTIRIADGIYLNPIYQDSIWDRVRQMRLGPSGNYKYSDLSMYLMKELLERILSTHIEKYVDSAFYRPMGLRRIGYAPLGRFERDEIVPTEDDRYWRRQVLQGDVHDPTVAFLGGIGGPAGIFSNSNDLATVMQMLMNGGSYGGKQFFNPKTVRKFTGRQPNSRRALGFDMQLPTPSEERGYCCYSAAPQTYGHFGYTGTCAWADPENKVVYVFLSNRVYPTSNNRKINSYRIRQSVQQLIYDALGIGLVPPEGMEIAVQDHVQTQ